MFNRHESGDQEAPHNPNETIIAQGVKVEGDFVSEGDVVIEGEVTGNVKTRQHLRVGGAAHINADVSAQAAVIAGEVRGNLTIGESLELLETSVVHGDIEARILSVAPGAKINGRLTMDSDGGERGKGKKSEPPSDATA